MRVRALEHSKLLLALRVSSCSRPFSLQQYAPRALLIAAPPPPAQPRDFAHVAPATSVGHASSTQAALARWRPSASRTWPPASPRRRS
eukprot:5584554-Alexandrium_andersonii.AAC.1